MVEYERENNDYESEEEDDDECEPEEDDDILDAMGNSYSDENDSAEQVVENKNEEQLIKHLEIVEDNNNEENENACEESAES